MAAGGLGPVDTNEKWAVNYNASKDWMFRLKHDDIVVGKSIPPKVLITSCGYVSPECLCEVESTQMINKVFTIVIFESECSGNM